MSGGAKSYFGSVVFLDRLGTKGIWKNADGQKVVEDYESLMSSIESQFTRADKEHVEKIRKIGIDVELKITTFSDTIIVTFAAPLDQKEKLQLPLTVNSAIINLLTTIPICLSANIFLRGAVSIGQFYRSKNLMVGPAIDEAAMYYQMSEWIGVSAAPSAHRIITTAPQYNPVLENFVKWDIPLKNGIEKGGWALNWPSVFHEGQPGDSKVRKKLRDEVRETILKEMQTIDVGVALKWRNTYDFFQANNYQPAS